MECQLFVEKHKLPPLPLNPIKAQTPFQKWVLDFIDEIHPSSSGKHKWILRAKDYCTKWVDVVLIRLSTIDLVFIKFLEENILSGF